MTMFDEPALVSLVGAGPGDPELLTLKGLRRLQEADAVVYDALANDTLLQHCQPNVERHYAGKRAGTHCRSQGEINDLLVSLARQGKRVVRLKGGDPFIFGRGGEEAEALEDAGVPWEVVPGVSSGVAAPAYAGIPLTHRDWSSSVTFVTGHEDPARVVGRVDWEGLGQCADTLVIFMGVHRLREISTRLIAGGRAPGTPAAAIRWGTTDEQSVVEASLQTLADAAEEAGLSAPAVIVVGEVVALRERLHWFDPAMHTLDDVLA
jgi:uroporphyrin-III C-methyltransferase